MVTNGSAAVSYVVTKESVLPCSPGSPAWQQRASRAILTPIMADDIEDIRFAHTEVRAGDRLLVKSECVFCGMSMMLSAADGSLQKWERWHVCDNVIGVGSGPIH